MDGDDEHGWRRSSPVSGLKPLTSRLTNIIPKTSWHPAVSLSVLNHLIGDRRCPHPAPHTRRARGGGQKR